MFTASLVLAFVVLSMLADSGAATQHVLTGRVVEFRAGEWISVINDTTDPTGVRIALREATAYEDRGHDPVRDRGATKPGDRVTVWYRSVGERRPVADKMRVLHDVTTP